mmetsp:Transcript_26232/g.48058  ORF Transcript_26232/g.48058 Transcript_26232/m.48058 type:complete len:283 (-) Transcript_26232:304-1152(-)
MNFSDVFASSFALAASLPVSPLCCCCCCCCSPSLPLPSPSTAFWSLPLSSPSSSSMVDPPSRSDPNPRLDCIPRGMDSDRLDIFPSPNPSVCSSFDACVFAVLLSSSPLAVVLLPPFVVLVGPPLSPPWPLTPSPASPSPPQNEGCVFRNSLIEALVEDPNAVELMLWREGANNPPLWSDEFTMLMLMLMFVPVDTVPGRLFRGDGMLLRTLIRLLLQLLLLFQLLLLLFQLLLLLLLFQLLVLYVLMFIDCTLDWGRLLCRELMTVGGDDGGLLMQLPLPC